jgi:hypothetical protein
MITVTVYFYTGSDELGLSYTLNGNSTVQTLKQAIVNHSSSPFHNDSLSNFRITAYPPTGAQAKSDTDSLADDGEYHAAKQ